MANAKTFGWISALLIAIIWVGFFAGVTAPFIGELSSNYGSNFDESQISVYNKLSNVTDLTEETQNSVTDYKEKSGIADIVGDIFSQGYKTLKIMANSLDIFKELMFNSFNNSKYNIPAMQNLKTAIILTVVILIIIGVIVKAVVKSDV